MSAEATRMTGAPILTTSSQLRRRQIRGQVMRVLFLAATLVGIMALVVLLWTIFNRGLPWLSWHLITDMPSRKPELAGLNSALWGTIWVISLTALIAFPIGVGAAIFLEEYAPRNRWTRALQVNISNLAGVPSVVYGLLGLGIFVQFMNLGRVVLAGALTMALLSLPVIIISSQEAIRAVPLSLRQAAYGVGATRWQVTRHHVLPAAFPGILTGTILAVSRAIGETAPVLVVGASAYIATRPSGFFDGYTVLPMQIYGWTQRSQDQFKNGLAPAGIIILLAVLLIMNAAAIILRQKLSKRSQL
ncbi:MAG TPA: phosphate ABC transporter permease PstA [Thermomicrobiales bacterium]|jgi:phosphate transport system permease protein|nr:phosphate ABC transporter permease PstA [Thermomicrobiales bacterium]